MHTYIHTYTQTCIHTICDAGDLLGLLVVFVLVELDDIMQIVLHLGCLRARALRAT
jgi:hypothetical protein